MFVSFSHWNQHGYIYIYTWECVFHCKNIAKAFDTFLSIANKTINHFNNSFEAIVSYDRLLLHHFRLGNNFMFGSKRLNSISKCIIILHVFFILYSMTSIYPKNWVTKKFYFFKFEYFLVNFNNFMLNGSNFWSREDCSYWDQIYQIFSYQKSLSLFLDMPNRCFFSLPILIRIFTRLLSRSYNSRFFFQRHRFSNCNFEILLSFHFYLLPYFIFILLIMQRFQCMYLPFMLSKEFVILTIHWNRICGATAFSTKKINRNKCMYIARSIQFKLVCVTVPTFNKTTSDAFDIIYTCSALTLGNKSIWHISIYFFIKIAFVYRIFHPPFNWIDDFAWNHITTIRLAYFEHFIAVHVYIFQHLHSHKKTLIIHRFFFTFIIFDSVIGCYVTQTKFPK